MMKSRLRHIHGPNLQELELILEKKIPNHEVLQITRSNNGEWYIHFLLASDLVISADNDQSEMIKLKELKKDDKNVSNNMDRRRKRP